AGDRDHRDHGGHERSPGADRGRHDQRPVLVADADADALLPGRRDADAGARIARDPARIDGAGRACGRQDLPGRHPDVWKAAQRTRAHSVALLLTTGLIDVGVFLAFELNSPIPTDTIFG